MTDPTTKPGRRIKVLFLFRDGRVELIEKWKSGQGPGEFLYGMQHMDQTRFETSFVEGYPGPGDWRKKLCLPLENFIARRVGIGFGLHVNWRYWDEIKRADVIVSTLDTRGLPLAMFKYLGLSRARLVYFSQGLAHRVEPGERDSLKKRIIRAVYSRFLRRVEKFLVLGEGAVSPLVQVFSLDPARVDYIPFGVDQEFWTPGGDGEPGDYVLSVGSDAGRDYPTFLRAVSDEKVRIITRQPLPGELLKPNVRVSRDHSDLELRDIYRGARFFVAPLRDIDQPSGQSASLQAMACGKAVVLTRTRGLWEGKYMRDRENCLLVRPNDPEELRKAMRFLEANPGQAERIGKNARRLIEERYTSREFAAMLGRHVEEVFRFKG